MSDEQKPPQRRKFDFGLGEEKSDVSVNVMGPLEQLLGGVGTGLGQAFAAKLNERVLLTAAALAGQYANPTNNGDIEATATDAVRCADAVLKRLEETDDERFTDPLAKPNLSVAPNKIAMTAYHDAVQRLTESCDSFAERLKGDEQKFFKARIEAVREAGNKL